MRQNFVSVIVFSAIACSSVGASAADCHGPVLKAVLSSLLKSENFSPVPQGKISYEVNQSNLDENDFVVTLEFINTVTVKDRLIEVPLTENISVRLKDSDTCSIQSIAR